MDIILYNPLSSNGKTIKPAEKFAKKLRNEGKEVIVKSLLTITDVKKFLNGYTAEDRIIIFGGDGTIHRIANSVEGIKITPQVYLYKAGTGNDFIRSVEVHNHLAEVKPYIKRLPTLHVNGKRMKVINGAGVGLDGLVAYKVNKSKEDKNKSNYFKNAVSAFFQFKPVSGTITVDGKSFSEKKIWFASAMFSQYFGGGMKIAPKKDRKDPIIELVIVKNIPKLVLVLIFPIIYLGWHRFLTRWVKFYRGNNITVKFDQACYLQADGEHEYPVKEFNMIME